VKKKAQKGWLLRQVACTSAQMTTKPNQTNSIRGISAHNNNDEQKTIEEVTEMLFGQRTPGKM
jgi:hypothetical protein